jgi:hypothetical protein
LLRHVSLYAQKETHFFLFALVLSRYRAINEHHAMEVASNMVQLHDFLCSPSWSVSTARSICSSRSATVPRLAARGHHQGVMLFSDLFFFLICNLRRAYLNDRLHFGCIPRCNFRDLFSLRARLHSAFLM